MLFPQKVNKEEYEKAASTSRCDDELRGSDGAFQPIKQPRSNLKKYLVVFILVLLAFSAGYYAIQPYLKADLGITYPFEVQVYCPVNKVPQNIRQSGIQGKASSGRSNDNLRFLTEEVFKKVDRDDSEVDMYVIWVEMRTVNASTNASKLLYCSYVTDWTSKDCSIAVHRCTLPGAMFYVEKDKPIDVAWINNIENEGGVKYFDNELGCIKKNQTEKDIKRCTWRRKNASQLCTYQSPTNQIPSNTYTADFKGTLQNIPTSPHVHGLQVRPSFDGNPMSWLGRGGQHGVAFQSIINGSEYYKHFQESVTTKIKIPESEKELSVKVSRYENVQPPGSLWYHDHSMDMTASNVFHGLNGNYLIYANQTEEDLPGDDYNIFIIAGQFIQNDTLVEDPESGKNHNGMRANPKNAVFRARSHRGDVLERNQVYRVRILNGQFDSYFTDLRFLTECQNQLQPTPDTCKSLSFSVIGSDSALFQQPVKNVSSIKLSSAERMEILIIFDGRKSKDHPFDENPIASGRQKVFFVSNDQRFFGKDIRLTFFLEDASKPTIYPWFPSEKGNIKGIPQFYDLRKVDKLCSQTDEKEPNCITLRRSKQMEFKEDRYVFNGHPEFSTTGATDNPRIGTTQEWIFYSLVAPHPIHFHLVNFQIVGEATIKRHSSGCFYARLDFYLNSGMINCTKINCSNYDEVCAVIQNISVSQAEEHLRNYLPEDAEPSKDKFAMVGFNIYEENDDPTKYISASCAEGIQSTKYKYICHYPTDEGLPEWYRRWKEVTVVQSGKLAVFRIRWTATDYPFDGKKDSPYFRIPEDQLIEYPGYVYHCHFLNHEDLGLMRPFQMLPSDQFESRYNVTGTALGDCMDRCGFKNKDGWKARYKCINQLTGCTEKAC